MPPLPFKQKGEEILVIKNDVPEGYEVNDEWIKPLSEEYVSRWGKPVSSSSRWGPPVADSDTTTIEKSFTS